MGIVAGFGLKDSLKLLSDLEPVLVGLGTIALAIFTWRLWISTAGLWKHTRTIERAYVKLSHKPPGVYVLSGAEIRVTIQVTNMGHTPATVTEVMVTPIVLDWGQALPPSPIYEAPGPLPSAKGFLGSDEPFFVHASFEIPEWPEIRAGQKLLFLVGYVDYIDAFGVRHRGGYGRRYDPRLDRANLPTEQINNLTVVPDLDYNYDRPRHRNEGNDWNALVGR
jgi:hypothetical protein